MITIKRIYEPADKTDGYRILVDRLWPRGISKVRAKLDLWLKDIGPSNELRKWFGHRPERWGEFRRRYLRELRDKSDQMKELRMLAKKNRKMTLLYGAQDAEHNQAVVLKEKLR